eukprot:TRINITY_DN8079_c2_g1_i1.p1 TRINITY_DN8079_c2_g1~~TRINITY_DN8079_c2_g1_i1.p1  ORF type:complete len:195 (+),score=40.69 TRINITY_DN8079_c2_g1_i1:749-1333(+)
MLQDLEDVKPFLECISRFFSVSSSSSGFVWSLVGADTELKEKTKVTKIHRNGHDSGNAIGPIAWNSGIHVWKLRVDSPIQGATTSDRIHWIVMGVAVQQQFRSDFLPTYYHVSGKTFGYGTYGGIHYSSLGKVSGSDIPAPPGTIFTLLLDCDEGTLSFSSNNSEFFKINVPKNTFLAPWVHLHTVDNSVTLIN